MLGTSDARWGCADRSAVERRELRGAGASGSSVAGNSRDRERGAGGAVAEVREALCPFRMPSADGRRSRPRNRGALLLQAFSSVRSAHQLIEKLDYNLYVPLVCRVVAGCHGVGREGVHQEPRAADRR
jgi:hypothetical protein